MLHLKHIYLGLQIVSGLCLGLRLVIRSKIRLGATVYLLLLLRSWLLNLINNHEEILLDVIALLLLLLILIIRKLLNQLEHFFVLILTLMPWIHVLPRIWAVFVGWRLGSFAVRSHVEICLIDIIILLSVGSVVVDGGMGIVMVLDLNVWLWLRASSPTGFVLILLPVWLLLLFHCRVQNDPLLRTWRAKDAIVGKEVMEVLA